MTHPMQTFAASVCQLNEAITDYSAGNLSPAKHALMSCVVELNAEVAEAAAFETDVAASLMAEIRPVPLSPFLIGDTLAKLPELQSPPIAANDDVQQDLEQRLAPKPLRDLMDGSGLRDIKWKSVIPGVSVHDVLGNRKTRGKDRLYLLKVKAGMKLPEHSHDGEEWTLILSGSYTADNVKYRRGDLHIADETTHHAPQISDGADCICLVVAQGPLHMKSWIPRIVQQMVGI